MSARIGAGLVWLADYMRWRGAWGVVLLAWHLAFWRLAPQGRRIWAQAPGGRVRLRARTSDFRVFRKIAVQGEYALDARRMAAIDRRIGTARARGRMPLILDAGGNIGLFSQMAARRWPQATVVCIEPVAGNLEMARANCAGLPNVSFRRAAVWSAPGRVTLEDPDAREGAFAFRAADEGAVEAVTLDALLDALPDAELVLLKMDIEGAEKEALVPGARFWRHRPVILIEPHDFLPGRSATLRGLLSQPAYADADWEVRGESVFVFPPEHGAPVRDTARAA